MRVEEELCCHGQSSSKICNLVEVSLNIVLALNIPDTRDDIRVHMLPVCALLLSIFSWKLYPMQMYLLHVSLLRVSNYRNLLKTNLDSMFTLFK